MFKIDNMQITLQSNDKNQADITFDLDEIQTKAVIAILGIKPKDDKLVTVNSDEIIQELIDMKSNPLRYLAKNCKTLEKG